MRSPPIMQTYYTNDVSFEKSEINLERPLHGYLKTNGYSNMVPSWGSYLVLQRSPLSVFSGLFPMKSAK